VSLARGHVPKVTSRKIVWGASGLFSALNAHLALFNGPLCSSAALSPLAVRRIARIIASPYFPGGGGNDERFVMILITCSELRGDNTFRVKLDGR